MFGTTGRKKRARKVVAAIPHPKNAQAAAYLATAQRSLMVMETSNEKDVVELFATEAEWYARMSRVATNPLW